MQENNSIGYHIVNTEKLIGRYILDKFNKKAQHRVSPMQVMIMKYLLKNQNKKIFQQDICDTFNLRRSTVSGILTTMEKNDIIIRKVARDDPRKNEIKLTEIFVNNTKKVSSELRNLESLLEYSSIASFKYFSFIFPVHIIFIVTIFYLPFMYLSF